MTDALPHGRASAFLQSAQKNAQAARVKRETREAVTALKDAAEFARSFGDVYDSVRAQADAADAVWSLDEQWSRSVLRRAWDATNAPGAEDRVQGFGTHEDAHQDALNALEAARRLVVKAALKHDPRFAEWLMSDFERFLAERKQEETETTSSSDPTAAAAPDLRRRTLSAAGWQRLSIAQQLFEEGDYAHAAQAVAPLAAAARPTRELINFILLLRTRDARDAEGLYLRLLEATRADAGANVNDVLTLSTPFVAPGIFAYVGEDGTPAFDGRFVTQEERRAPPLPDNLRAAFYTVAAGVLLRPGLTGGHPEGALAVYYATNRLLSSFESEAPQLAPALQARRTALAAEMSSTQRDNIEASASVRGLSVNNPADPLQYVLGEVERAGTPSTRDGARLRAVETAARLALWERAHGIADQIEDAETRRDARLVISVRQVMNTSKAFEDSDAEDIRRAADLVRAADVPPEVRAAGLAQAAELAARAQGKTNAGQLLSEAAGYAAQAERGERRVTALALVALSASRAGDARLWEWLPALRSAADETEDLAFGALSLELTVGRTDGRLTFYALDRPLGLPEVYAAAARLDAFKTFKEARGFKDEQLRAAALLAAGRAVLEKNARSSASASR